MVPFLPLLPEILGRADPAVAAIRPRPDTRDRGRMIGAIGAIGVTSVAGREGGAGGAVRAGRDRLGL